MSKEQLLQVLNEKINKFVTEIQDKILNKSEEKIYEQIRNLKDKTF
jgi:hypothetical protein